MSENSLKVVCIEDEQEMIDLVKLILNQHGFEVIGALGGATGLKTVVEVQPDLILLDLMMPGIDGWEVLQKLRAMPEAKDVPVIMVTAKAQKIDRVLGLHVARVDDYITKPFGPQQLVKSVKAVLSKQAGTDDEAAN